MKEWVGGRFSTEQRAREAIAASGTAASLVGSRRVSLAFGVVAGRSLSVGRGSPAMSRNVPERLRYTLPFKNFSSV